MTTPTDITPIHQWTNKDGRVFLLRFSDIKHQSYGGFQWPKDVGSIIVCPDWEAKPSCGNGLHGWPWGIGLGNGKEPVFTDAMWQVVSALPEDIIQVENGPKVKAREVRLEYVGSWWAAFALIEKGRDAWTRTSARGAASNSGYGGAASNSGYGGAASNSGSRGAASNSGSRGAASNSGYGGAAVSTGGDSKSETTHIGTIAAVTGLGGKARASKFGCIALAWKNIKEDRIEMRCATVGKKKGDLLPDVWYELDDAGKFKKAQ